MKEKYNVLIKGFQKIPVFYLIVSLILFDIFISAIFSFLLFPEEHTNVFDFPSKAEAFFITVLFAPLIETALFQYFIISKLIKKFGYENQLFITTISASLFGLSHYYSMPYIIKAFITGFFYGTLYLVLLKRKKSPFLYVSLTHSIYNLIGFLIMNIL
jgi:membrane protease YdiL (CAAX protease family)